MAVLAFGYWWLCLMTGPAMPPYKGTRRLALATMQALVPINEPATYRSAEDLYRRQWRWDHVAWGSHCVNCYPGSCPYRVYVKDGIVLREEPSGSFQTVEQGVPDMNPMGCQKGAAWSQMLYAKERVLYPLRRAGERGSGQWRRISWDEALDEIADNIISTLAQDGPETIVNQGTPAEGGLMASLLATRFMNMVGGITTDSNGVINDFSTGLHITFGKFNIVSSVDDWFHSELLLIWHKNPAYTSIPYYHFIAEARYAGAEVITIAPDFSPSAVHADMHVPVEPGCDAALALSMCQVIVSEGLTNEEFIREQTDLALLVRDDNARFLRAADIEKNGIDDQFYVLTTDGKVRPAPRASLDLGNTPAVLRGQATVKLRSGSSVVVRPVFEGLERLLADYTPESAAEKCGVHPKTIRDLARKVASRRTNVLMGLNSCKYYHGDLIERSMCLLLALTGNWGKKGTGVRSWSTGLFDGPFLFPVKRKPGPEETALVLRAQRQMVDQVRQRDPTLTDEMAAIELQRQMAMVDRTVPPVFLWYSVAEFKQRWNNKAWNDPEMARPFDDYMREAIASRWFIGVDWPRPEKPPRVLIEVGGNTLRRTRGGAPALKDLWDGLRLVVSVDTRMSSTGMESDIILPAAGHYEKLTFQTPTPHTLNLIFSDRAVEPAGESKPEWEIFRLLSEAIERKAKEKSFLQVTDGGGRVHRLDNLAAQYTMNGQMLTEEQVAAEWVQDSAIAGTLPEGITLEDLREQGHVRFTDWGVTPFGLGQASDLRPDETHVAMRWHTEKKMPYPTLTRRAQFYIDHPWFIEAGEALPVHKPPPAMGGEMPLTLTGGHNRSSIHSINVINDVMLQTHRGEPIALVSAPDAEARQVADEDHIRIWNDVASFEVRARVAPSVRPGQVVVYNGWEPYQFKEWRDPAVIEPGMVKYLHLAGGYGHLRYRTICWQPVQFDRGIRVDFELAAKTASEEEGNAR
jgi:DMSO reductase family type II enzyme molybdopterin subunit